MSNFAPANAAIALPYAAVSGLLAISLLSLISVALIWRQNQRLTRQVKRTRQTLNVHEHALEILVAPERLLDEPEHPPQRALALVQPVPGEAPR